jgi:hypothetical protein
MSAALVATERYEQAAQLDSWTDGRAGEVESADDELEGVGCALSSPRSRIC